jgi:two-component system sensor kinase FixL
MQPFEKFLVYSESHRERVLMISALLVAVIAVVDWKVQPNVSLGLLYIFPIVLASGLLTSWRIAGYAAVCTGLREVFGPFDQQPETLARMAVVLAGFTGAGLLFSELSRNRQLALQLLKAREEAGQQLRVLIETSPLAILTLDSAGTALLANESANRLLGFDQESVRGQDVRPYLPILGRPLRGGEDGRSLRTTVECKGRRRNGEVFLANIWFSTYKTASGRRLAAVIWDASENLRDREGASLDSLMTTSRILVGAVSHELRNLAAAAACAYDNVGAAAELEQNKEFRALGALIKGLERVASSGLHFPLNHPSCNADLYNVLDEVRIVMEPALRESGIIASWEIEEGIPLVQANHQSLLQVFLNLSRNSLRAMDGAERKEFAVQADAGGEFIAVRFRDTGHGVRNPERLFRPFQAGAEESGLGLYVSKAILRCYDADLRYELQDAGSCFVVELQPAQWEGKSFDGISPVSHSAD